MKKVIPTGIVEYSELIQNNYYFVDKTLMIKDFLDNRKKVTLVTRPRRFGKTLNMSMMAEFFDIKKDSKDIFKGTNIMETEYANSINQYPTIFLTFKDANDTKEKVISYLKKQISKQYGYFASELDSIKMNIFEKKQYETIINELLDNKSTLKNITDSLSFLTNMLYKYYDKKVMLFIDEYDTPFIEAHINDFYEEIHGDLASLLSTTLKDNPYLGLSMLTGIQRVAKENVFSKLNNPVICTVADKKYSQYFGFTEDETKELLEYYGLELNEEVKEMYDGYHIGDTDVYNPWSILNYADNQEIETYWVDTSANTMIINAMENADSSFKDGFETLIKQNYLNTNVKMGTSFYEKSETSTLWGLFINAGYLTVDKKIKGRRYRIRIPNLEVVDEFKELLSYYMDVSSVEFLDNVIDSLQDENEKAFIDAYQKLLLVPSYYDYKNENSYHMLLFPLCLYLSNTHEVKSNSEEGKGRTDIILKAQNDKYASYVIEFKFGHKDSDDLDKLADVAYQQIIDNKYDATLQGRVIYIGLGVRLKEAAMKWIVR